MTTQGEDNVLDIDSPKFNSEAYLDRVLKIGSLKQIMDKENEVIAQSQYLQSEMQTLVYENYNKFISATETVRKMRSDFRTMQNEMKQLCENMEKITKFSESITNNIKDSGNNVSKLCATRQLLDKLQFLFLLPSQLNNSISQGKYQDAVNDYMHAQRVLQRYGGQPSFQGIQTECEEIIRKLKITLKERLQNNEASVLELAESVSLLVKLKDNESSLDEIFLSCAKQRMNLHVDNLQSLLACTDILEWVDRGNSTLLADMSIIVSAYKTFFPQEDSPQHSVVITEFANATITQYFDLAQKVLLQPSNLGTEMLVRGLDKFYKQLQAMTVTITADIITHNAIDIVIKAIIHKTATQINIIKNQFKESLLRVRQSLASKTSDSKDNNLKEILNSLHVYLLEKVQCAMLELMHFLQNGLSFSVKNWCFKEVANACWNIICSSLTNVAEMVDALVTSDNFNSSCPFELLLIMAKLCIELQENGINVLYSKMLQLLEEASPGEKIEHKDSSNVCQILSTAGQHALDAEVVFIGNSAAQMLRVSVLARDWLRAPEPRGPRAVCRRVVEALSNADSAAAQLFVMGTKQSSDSSRRTLWPRAPSSSFSPINRIFSERIEVFGPTGADRMSLSSGALKIALKALVECVRLRTFGKHGLQQLQVDVHFLHQRLSCMGYDERLLSALLEDALASAQLRCVDPQLMEPSIVDVICERG